MEKMFVDGHPLAKESFRQGQAGNVEEDHRIRDQFIQEVKDSGIDHCSCPNACSLHGKCMECVIVHRGHKDHLPCCFFDMVNEKMECLYHMTEETLGKAKE